MEEYGPSLAIDGVTSTSNTGFFHPGTKLSDEWFQIDMGSEGFVSKVFIGFRQDVGLETFPIRRENVEVRVGNIPATDDAFGNPVCANLDQSPDSFNVSLECQADGRYIVIKKADEEFWDLNEANAIVL